MNSLAFGFVLLSVAMASVVAMDLFDDLMKRSLCYDKAGDQCQSLQSYCKLSKNIEQNCEKTCKKCTPGRIEKCQGPDKSQGCPIWKKKGFCAVTSYKQFMYKNCPSICGFCTGGKPVPKPPPKPSSKPKCKGADKSPGCPIWKEKGFCENAMYKQFMHKTCPSVCDFCTGGPKPTIPERVNIDECLSQHNKYRQMHHVGKLEWDEKLAAEAKDYAKHLAVTNTFAHATNLKNVGENLAKGSNYHMNCKIATDNWYNEVKDYNFNNPGFAMNTGHFTQVVWKNTKKLGVGIAHNKEYTFVVARYSPGGNVNTRYHFKNNVFPK